MKANVEKANAIVETLTPLREDFEAEAKNIGGIDRSKLYFGVNGDGTATILSFNPANGAPKFDVALPLPAEPVLAPEPAESATKAENVVALEVPAQQ
jgi:hypothetical protein